MWKRSIGIESANLKLARAAKAIKAIQEEVSSYMSGNPYEVIPQADGTSDVKTLQQPDVSISVLVGEAIYHLRSAMDHLMFDVVEKYPPVGVNRSSWEEKCEFPMWKDLPEGKSAPLSKGDFKKWLRDIPDELFAFIEGLQPYYNRGYHVSLMGSIRNLSNIDKHRHLNVSVGMVRVSETLDSPFATNVPVMMPFRVTHGTDFQMEATESLSYDDMEVKRDISPTVVVFDKTLNPPYFALPSALVECLLLVANVVLPKFKKFI